MAILRILTCFLGIQIGLLGSFCWADDGTTQCLNLFEHESLLHHERTQVAASLKRYAEIYENGKLNAKAPEFQNISPALDHFMTLSYKLGAEVTHALHVQEHNEIEQFLTTYNSLLEESESPLTLDHPRLVQIAEHLIGDLQLRYMLKFLAARSVLSLEDLAQRHQIMDYIDRVRFEEINWGQSYH